MQMLGIGIPELLVIFLLAILVVGPDRLPELAADMARWIRQARAYGQHLTRDFSEVVSEIEKEAGTTRDDWKEIANVVGIKTNEVTKELNEVAADVEAATRVDDGGARPKVLALDATSRSPAEQAAAADEEAAAEAAPAAEGGSDAAEADDAEKPWYVPERSGRRRSSE